MLLCLMVAPLPAQNVTFHNRHTGLNISVNLAFGTHFQRLGVNCNLLYINNQFQSNTEVRAYFNFKNLGPKKLYPELVLSQGLLLGYGAYSDHNNPFFSSVSNQTGYINAVAYSYNVYLNKIKTSQQTGIVALQFKAVSFIVENDILARPSLDRFRTGAFLLQYQYRDQFQAGINCTLWTGKMGHQVALSNDVISSGCYMDTTGGVYPQLSHGLLSAQFKYNVGGRQNVQASAGVDAEQVRNTVQNKAIHDMVFLPKQWRPKNCYIPMIDDKGEQLLDKEKQRVRKPKPYLNLFSNAGLFY